MENPKKPELPPEYLSAMGRALISQGVKNADVEQQLRGHKMLAQLPPDHPHARKPPAA